MQSMSGNIDPTATRMADTWTGIESGPLCQAEVAPHTMKQREQSPTLRPLNIDASANPQMAIRNDGNFSRQGRFQNLNFRLQNVGQRGRGATFNH